MWVGIIKAVVGVVVAFGLWAAVDYRWRRAFPERREFGCGSCTGCVQPCERKD